MPAETTFDATQDTLENLLREINKAKIQLPDFQRGWVWNDEHIHVITSVSRSFPIGAIMTLQTGGDVSFQPRLIEGVEIDGKEPPPERLILDGQQRLTSLYQALTLRHAIVTQDDKRTEVERWYYADIVKALGSTEDRENAILSIPGDKLMRRDFGRQIILDVTTREKEYERQLFPLHLVFNSDSWFEGWMTYWKFDRTKIELFNRFRNEFINVFRTYSVPVIQLRRTASKEAVCLVFEKVNTGGVTLTAFELLTATYAADCFNLREDWYGLAREHPPKKGRTNRLADAGAILKGVENTDFLQAVSLLYTYARRQKAVQAGATGREVRTVSCSRQAILGLPLEEGYKVYANEAEEGFRRARQFLWREKIYSFRDLPYRTQLVPLAVILKSLGDQWQDDTIRAKVRQWYWCGVLGELYGSAIESRLARDLPEVVAWAGGDGSTPQTVLDCNFVTDRLLTLRSRLSAAYKGLHALIMQKGGAQDWRTGAGIDEQTYFNESIDIHHIFPRAWCEKQKISSGIYNCILNKTALSGATNRFLQGDAPSVYLRRLEEQYRLIPERVDGFLRTHFIKPEVIRSNQFEALMQRRGDVLCAEIAEATGRPVGGPSMTELLGSELPSEADEEDDS
jgi:hypothetical protein